MLTTMLIAFREFLEVFLIIGVFLGISKKLNLKREKEILLASFIGITSSLLLAVITFTLGDKAKGILNERNADILEGYLMVFSGFFIAYVIFSLHTLFALKRSKTIIAAHQKLQSQTFDLSLFLTIIFFIIREGFEIALFTATTSLFSQFIENIAGLLGGLALSGTLGLILFYFYKRFPIGKVFKYTEFLIVLLGANFIKNGLTELTEHYLHIYLSNIFPIRLLFLPSNETFIGHFLKNIMGVEQDFSLAKLAIIGFYFLIVYWLFRKRKQSKRMTNY